MKLKNKIIKTIEVRVAKMVNLAVPKFKKGLVGKKIVKVWRRGKMIIIELAGEKFLLVHLKMTGQLVYRKNNGQIAAVGGHPLAGGLENLPNKFTRIIFSFSDSSQLFFNDLRKFGWLRVVDNPELLKVINKYGLEPLAEDWTRNNFKNILTRYPRRKVKQLLLDQELIAGIGNIYADESCFFARVLPTRLVQGLTSGEIDRLLIGIPRIMRLSIKHGGTSTDTYVRSDGTKGNFMVYLKVYGRAGERCQRQGCQGVIKKIKLNGRGTHYCPRCQK